ELAQHKSQNVFRACAERHSDSNLLRSLSHRIGNHTVNAGHCQHECERCEHNQDDQGKATSADRIANQLIDSLNLIYGLVLVDFANRCLNCSEGALRIYTRAHCEIHAAISSSHLRECEVNFRLDSFVERRLS